MRPQHARMRPLQRMISLDRYSAVLRTRETRLIVVASVLGRLPIGVTGLAVLLLVQRSNDSFAQAGAASAAYVAGLASFAPVLGRWIDRAGPQAPLLFCGIVFPSALTLLVAAVSAGEAELTVLLSAMAGAGFPPISVCMRTYFRHRLADERLLAAAYSLESVLIELIFIAGPLIVAVFVAASSPALAVLFAAACGGIGSFLFRSSSALQGWRHDDQKRSGLLGPLANPRFSALIAVVLCYAMAFGLLEIGITAYATERDRPALAGVLLGLMSAGSALGGLAYGSRSWGAALSRQFAATLAIMGIGLAVLAIPWSPWLFAPLTVLAGIVIAPALIIQSILVSKAAASDQVTEAFTWSTSALLGGIGLGLLAGGALLELWTSAAAFGVAGAAAMLAALAARLVLEG